MNERAIKPIEVRAPRGARTMEIVWADGHVGVLPHDILRGFCPCAACQGHQGPIRFVEGGNLELTEVEETGSYALRLGWQDGHGTGIYTFRLLRELCCCPVCAPDGRRKQTFGR